LLVLCYLVTLFIIQTEKENTNIENTNTDLNYNSAESVNSGDNDANNDTTDNNTSDDDNDIYYDSESSDDEEDINHSTSNNALQNTNRHVAIEEYADPNYNSSDNEDLNNDICYDEAS
jgi:cytoskeletal protein RodZ